MPVVRAGAKSKRKGSICGSLRLVIVLMTWFTATVCVLLHNKSILSTKSVTPLQITFGQSTVGMLMDTLVLVGCTLWFNEETKGNHSTVSSVLANMCPSPTRRRELLPLCAAFILTKLLTLYSIALIPASLTYTIKATSPIFTVVIAYFALGKVFSRMTYLSLVPISMGVAMAAVSKFEFSAPGLCYAVTSVGMGVGYQMYMKSLMDSHGSSSSPRSVITSRATASVGDVVQQDKPLEHGGSRNPKIPSLSPGVTVATPTGLLITAANKVAHKSSDFYSNFINTTTLHVQIAMAGMFGTLLISLIEGMYQTKQVPHETVAGSSGSNAGTGSSFSDIPLLTLIVNGMFNYVASLSSYVLLSLTSNLTWQITNAMKRLVVIVASVLYFRNPLTVLNICGICLAVAGVSLYEAVRKPAGHPEAHMDRTVSGVELGSIAGSASANSSPNSPTGIVINKV